MDFLKSFPSFTMQDYIWGLSAPMIQIMAKDATQIIYLDEKQQQEYKTWKRTSRTINKVYTDSKEDLDAFEKELGI